ncbi:MAG: hypothetical protein Q4B28_06900 [bacterium]|nr:hypothetical protein [bacterium]
MLKKYEYVGQHHTMVALEKGQPKVRVEPEEVVETELQLPKSLFKLVDQEAEAKKQAEAEEQAKKEAEAKAKAEAKKQAEAEAKKKK